MSERLAMPLYEVGLRPPYDEEQQQRWMDARRWYLILWDLQEPGAILRWMNYYGDRAKRAAR